MIKFKPAKGKLLVEPEKETKKGKIILATEKSLQKGKVLAMNQKDENVGGVGFTAYWSSYSGTVVNIDGKELLVLDEKDVLGYE